MKTNVNIIKKLASLGVLDTEPVLNDHTSGLNKNENDITIESVPGVTYKVITDNVTDEDLPLLIATEQLKAIKSIKSMVKFTFVLGLIAAGIWLLVFLRALSYM